MKYDLTIIVPVKNEEKNIGLLIKEIEEKIINIDKLQLYFVDDGSDDKSWSIIKSLRFHNTNHKISGIKLNRNYGKDLALYAALDKINSKYFVFYDCDMQFDVDYLNRMYSIIKKGYVPLIQGKKIRMI